MNQILALRSEYLAKYGRKLSRITRRLESSEIETELKLLNQKRIETNQQRKDLNNEYEFTFGKQEEFCIKQRNLKNQIQEINKKINALYAERSDLEAERHALKSFITTLESLPDKLTKFSDKAFLSTIDHISVSRYVLAYHLYGDECIKVNIEQLKLSCQ